ncbi:MAG: HAD hydrolase-like protein [Acetatifactor sp.]|nr:HAD hydrolase-like protein [Acetatifactor sp.]
MKKYFLFDLDGTLTDPKVGITTCVQYALHSFGIEEPDLDKLEPFIGPPLKNSFMEFYGMDEEQAGAAVEKYRERFSETGLFENEIYSGIACMLKNLSEKGFRLAVASSKPTVFVEKILEHFGIRQYFEVVVGSELDGRRTDKDQVVQEALRQLFGAKPILCQEVYMIGDRRFDVEGARAMKVESIGVTYGYGDMEELKEARADYIVESVEELQELLLRELCEVQPKGFMALIGPMLFPFLLFMLIRRAVSYGALWLAVTVEPHVPAGLWKWLYYREETTGELGYTGNLGSVMSALSYAVAGICLIRMALPVMHEAGKRMALSHLRRERPKNYIIAVLAAVCAVLGLNLLFDLAGIINSSASYQAVAQSQFSASLTVGLVCYGIVTPLAEELIFRGIVYNELKTSYKLSMAMLVSSLLFGLYHMNPVQGIYGFIMGMLIVYLYEYFGSFLWPVLVHVLANSIAYVLRYTDITGTLLYSWPAAIVLCVLTIAGIWMLNLDKKKLKGPVVE